MCRDGRFHDLMSDVNVQYEHGQRLLSEWQQYKSARYDSRFALTESVDLQLLKTHINTVADRIKEDIMCGLDERIAADVETFDTQLRTFKDHFVTDLLKR